MSLHRAAVARLLAVLSLLVLLPAGALMPTAASAANPSGSLRIDVITAHNLVVDSNVESPATYAPEAATIGAKFCNTGSQDLTNVFASIGNYNGGVGSTPGSYPRHAQAPLLGPLQPGNQFALTHEGGSAGLSDATRFVPRIPAGQCAMQYWLVSYPRLDTTGQSVTQGVKPGDDLWLNYDIWATASEGAATLRADVRKTLTMRNEISAAANKIWPNGDNKVPDVYKQAISALLGWNTFAPSGGTVAYPGETVTTQGIWYDLGNVGAGFDNNGDYVPDYNAWLQPIGDPSSYDPGCFRLVRSYGIVIVKLVGGGEKLYPFIDQLYFENIPDNTGAVGLVFYEYAALDGACTAGLSPYQEVASGYDNEKFSGDYGFGIPPLQSRQPSFSLTKTVDKPVINSSPASDLAYTIGFQNTSPVAVGSPANGTPVVLRDSIPAGATYAAGSASAANASLPAGVGVGGVLFSTDGGATWSTAEPPAASVTDIQWWLSAPLQPGASGSVTFRVSAPTSAAAIIPNTAGASFGGGQPFATAEASTLVRGVNSVSGSVFRDTGVGYNFGNATREGDETGISGVAVTLLLDTDGDGAGDLVYATQSAAGDGSYSFTQLPDGRYTVSIGAADASLPAGFTNTTPIERSVNLDAAGASAAAVSVADQSFGFAAVLDVAKRLTSAASAAEGSLVTYEIAVANRVAGDGATSPQFCTYLVPASVAYQMAGNPPGGGNNQSVWGTAGVASSVNGVTGLPDGTFVSANIGNNLNLLGLGDFNVSGTPKGTISSLKLRVHARETANLASGVSLNIQLFYNAAASSTLAALGGSGASQASFDVSTLFSQSLGTDYVLNSSDIAGSLKPGGGPWLWSDFTGSRIGMQLRANNGTGNFQVDSAMFVVTTDAICEPTTFTTLNPVPLSDTYDASKLEFVSAAPSPTSVSAGALSWGNVGPIVPGQTKTVLVTFKALQPATNPEVVTNNVAVAGATFADGRPANDDAGSASVSVTPTGSLAGRVWADADSDGAIDAPAEIGLSGVTVQLYACRSGGVNIFPGSNTANTCTSGGGSGNGGTWDLAATTTTKADGSYLFEGLANGYYYAQVSTASVPGYVAQTGDPNVAGVCAGAACDSRSASLTATLAAFDQVVGAGSDVGKVASVAGSLSADNIVNVNFGYTVSPGLFGTVWIDTNGSTTRDAIESLVYSGAAVGLYTTSGGACTNTLASVSPNTAATDSSGGYRFSGLTAGVQYCVKLTTPSGFSATTVTSLTPTAAAGQLSGPYNFGLKPTASYTIGDTLYYDLDGSGTRGTATVERGIPGVTVELFVDQNGNGVVDVSDQLLGSATTDAAGAYLFSTVPGAAGTFAGSYITHVVASSLPTGLKLTADPSESGVCASCDGAALIAALSANTLTHDYGYQPTITASVGDTVWYDRNGDGLQVGPQEIGLAGVTVRLFADRDGNGAITTTAGSIDQVASAVTAADGTYSFSGLLPGSHIVQVDTASAALPKDAFGNNLVPSTTASYAAVVSGGAVSSLNGQSCTGCDMKADVGFTALAAIGDSVFWDANGNGQQDWSEVGVAGVTVTVTNLDPVTAPDGTSYLAGALVRTTTTSAAGAYLFTSLPTSSGGVRYRVSVTSASGPIGGAAQTADPERDGVSCQTPNPPLPATPPPACDEASAQRLYYGSVFMGADFGYQPPGAIGDRIWNDLDSDGAQDAGEPGIAGVEIARYADSNANGVFDGGDVLIDTRTSDPDGGYVFSNAVNGSYVLVVNPTTLPASFAQTGDPDVAGFCGAGCDGQAPAVVAGGSSILTRDFGYRLTGALSLSGTVCYDDLSLDGLCDGAAGEAALSGATVYLSTQAGQLIGSATTTAGGDYSFGGLPAGTYVVSVPTGSAAFDGASLTTTAAGTGVTSVASGSGAVLQTLTLSATRGDVDFAFERAPIYDFGDLPAGYGTALGGPVDPARHLVAGAPGVTLGSAAPDAEIDGVPSPTGLSDDTSASDDEDGVAVTQAWAEGAGGGSVQVTTSGGGYLVGFIDFNRDGDVVDGGERVISQAVGGGTVTAVYTFDIPAGTLSSGTQSFPARFRIFPAAPPFPSLAYAGAADGGEVEDYVFTSRLEIDKDVASANVTAGGSAIYTIVVTNAGAFPLTGVTVADAQLPGDFSLASATILETAATRTTTTSPAAGATSNLQWGAWTIQPSGSVRITLVADTNTSALGTYSNTATADSDQTPLISDDGTVAQDPNAPAGEDPATDEDVTIIPAAPDLALSKVADTATVAPGDLIVYTLTYQNVGSIGASGVTLTETVPAGTSFVVGSSSPGWTCAASGAAGDTCTFAIGALAAGAPAADVTFAVRIDAAAAAGVTQIANSATIGDSPDNDTVTTNDTGTATTALIAAPDLTLTKSDAGASVTPGGLASYTLTAQNVGNQDASGVTLTETVPANTSFVAASSSPGWSCAVAGAAGDTCTLAISGGIPTGGSASATFAVRVGVPLAPAVTQLANSASVADDGANGADPTPADNQASDTTPVVARSLGGQLWIERDPPATFGGSDVPLAGIAVTVTWLGPDGVPGGGDDLAFPTLTATDGSYSVTSLPDGDFRVSVGTIPSALSLVTGSDPASVTLSAASPTGTADFAYQATASITGLLWTDISGNAAAEAGEPVLPGVTVTVTWAGPDGDPLTLADNASFPTTTGPDGRYRVDTLPGGSYTVAVGAGVPAGLSLSAGMNPTTGVVPTGTPATAEVDFGYRGAVALGGWLWADTSGDGSYTASEPVLPGVTLTVTWGGPDGDLATAGDNQQYPTTSGSDGRYSLTGLPEGRYHVAVGAGVPAGLTLTAGSSPADLTITVASSPGSADFGYRGTGSLGGLVWTDANNNGAQDGGELALGGVTVRLVEAGPDTTFGTPDDVTAFVPQVTDASGAYSFTALPAGRYRAVVDTTTLPPNMSAVYDLDGGQDDRADAALATGQMRSDVSFGYLVPTVDLTLTKSDAGASVTPGGLASYTLTAQNVGNQDASGVTLTETVPANTRFVATSSSPGWSCTASGAAGDTCTLAVSGGIPAGGSASATFAVRVGVPLAPSVTTVSNTASIADDGTNGADPTPADNQASDTTPVVARSLGGQLWVERDPPATFGGSDIPLAGIAVTVTWLGPDGVPGGGDDLAFPTLTATDGSYSVGMLPDGEFRVTVGALPSGLTLVSGTDPASVTLSTATPTGTADFAYQASASITGLLWTDISGNAAAEAGEPVLPGVTVTVTWAGPDGDPLTLADNASFPTTTGPDGRYRVDTLPGGSYTVAVGAGVPAGLSLSSGTNPTVKVVPTGTPATAEVDFGYRGAVALGGRLWVDTSGDGSYTASEPVLPGVTLTVTWGGPDGDLTTAGDNQQYPTTSGSDGRYSLTGLPEGRYRVAVGAGVPAGLTLTSGSSPTDLSVTIATTPGSANFGYRGTGSLGGLVWHDADRSGSQNGGELALGGVTVRLIEAGPDTTFGTPDDVTAFVPQVTDASGAYSFTALPAGRYRAMVDTTTLPPNMSAVYDLDGGQDDRADAPLATGQMRSDVSFGYLLATVDLRIGISDGGATIAPGGTIVYTLPYTNTGTATASGVTITIVVPAGTTFNPASSTPGWSCTPSNGAGSTCTIAVGNLGSSASGTVRYAVSVPNPLPGSLTMIRVDASIGDDGTKGVDPTPNNNVGGVSTSVGPTAITLTHFSAAWEDGAVAVRWTTSAEVNTWGFDLYRSADGTRAGAERVTASTLLSRGRGRGASYVWEDRAVTPGETYTYWLVETEVNGTTNEYGPSNGATVSEGDRGRVVFPLITR